MRRLNVLSILAGASVFAVACTGGDSTRPANNGGMSMDRQPGTCAEITQQQINALFPPGMRGDVSSQLAAIRNDVKKGNTTQAQTEMFQLWQEVLNAYYAGSLNGNKSPDTQSMTLNFGAQVYCLVGLDGSSFLIGNPLDGPNKLQVVFPSGSDQDVVSGNGGGGTRITGGALSGPTTVSLVLVKGTFDPFKGPLNTKLDQYGPFFEIHIVPAQSLNTTITIAQCLIAPSGDVPASVHLAHNVGSGIEILPAVQSFLDCSNFTGYNGPSASEYFASGEPMNALKALGRAAVRAVSPRVAYAGGVGVGGKTSSFSPYGGVDTATVIEAASSTTLTGPAAAPVAPAPSVRVRTTGAHTPLDGAHVHFAITAGSGGVTGADQVTGNDGTATVGSWAINVGANSMTATGAFSAPPTGVGVGIGGNPVTFTATGGDIISWEGSGYSYLAGPTGHDAGFQAPSFDASSWSTGQGAFGDHNAANLYCPLDASVHTNWVSVPVGTDMLLRHNFAVGGGWSHDLSISVAIDNDIQIWVNGTEITSGLVIARWMRNA